MQIRFGGEILLGKKFIAEGDICFGVGQISSMDADELREIKERLIPPLLTPKQTSVIYASEADLLNVAMFGITAAQWRQANPDQSGNMRDAATLEQLVVLSNLESINAVLIHQGLAAPERLAQLNSIAITQMRSLVGISEIKQLSGPRANKGRA